MLTNQRNVSLSNNKQEENRATDKNQPNTEENY